MQPPANSSVDASRVYLCPLPPIKFRFLIVGCKNSAHAWSILCAYPSRNLQIAAGNGSAADFSPEVTSRPEIAATFFFLASVTGHRNLGKTCRLKLDSAMRELKRESCVTTEQDARAISRRITVQLPISGRR